MSRTLPALSAAVVAAAAVTTLAAPASGGPSWPRPDTVVEVTGSRANGFAITYYDGSREFTPTGSEARAECSEYDTLVARVRCTAEVRTRYAGLAETRRALRYARSARR